MADSSKPSLWEGEHLSSLILSQYHTKDLPPDDRENVDSHLQSCPHCRQKLADLEQEDRELLSLVHGFARIGVPSSVERLNVSPIGQHLSYDTLEQYVQNTLREKDRALVETHCASCLECSEELELLVDLEGLAQRTTEELAIRAKPELLKDPVLMIEDEPPKIPAMKVASPIAIKQSEQGSYLPPKANWWQQFFVPLQTAVVACLLFVGFLSINLNNQLNVQKTRTAASQNSIAQLQKEKDAAEAEKASLASQLEQTQQTSGQNQGAVAKLKKRIEALQGEGAAKDRQIAELRSQNNGVVPPTESPAPTAAPRLAPDIRTDGSGVIVQTEGGYRRFAEEQKLSPRAIQALTEGKLPAASSSDALRTQLSNSKGGADLQVISPVATRVRQQRPTFNWEAVKGASAYRVIIKDESDEGDDIYSPRLQGTQWTLSSPLPRGRKYNWTVQALKSDTEFASPAQSPRFAVLSDAENRALDLKLQKANGSPLEQSVILAEAGVREEAEEKFRPFAPHNSKR